MNVCDYTFPERFADKAQDTDKVDDTGGKYIMPTEEINVTTADDVDKFDDIDSKYNMPDVDKDTVEEIVQESDGKYVIHQKDTDKVEIIMGGLIDDDFIIMSSSNKTGEHHIFCIFIYRWIRQF